MSKVQGALAVQLGHTSPITSGDLLAAIRPFVCPKVLYSDPNIDGISHRSNEVARKRLQHFMGGRGVAQQILVMSRSFRDAETFPNTYIVMGTTVL